jgi:hypothetical protein
MRKDQDITIREIQEASKKEQEAVGEKRRLKITSGMYLSLSNLLRERGVYTNSPIPVGDHGQARIENVGRFEFPGREIVFVDLDGWSRHRIKFSTKMGKYDGNLSLKPEAFIISICEKWLPDAKLLLIGEKEVEGSNGKIIEDIAQLKKIRNLVKRMVRTAYKTFPLGTLPLLRPGRKR